MQIFDNTTVTLSGQFHSKLQRVRKNFHFCGGIENAISCIEGSRKCNCVAKGVPKMHFFVKMGLENVVLLYM